MLSILNSVFAVMFYPTAWTKLDHTFICFKEFLKQLNLIYKYTMIIYACFMIRKKSPEKLKISNHNFFQVWILYACKIDKKQLIKCVNYIILNSKFYPSYLCNISVFHVISNIFSLFFNEVLISLHSYLDSTHTNCSTATCGVFNFL
jgi:hypothetical protein